MIASEHHAAYRTNPGTVDDAQAVGDTDGDEGRRAPFGLPVLAELPDLADALTDLVEADRRLVLAVVALARHVDADEVAMASGVGVEHWLGIVARATRMDRRVLLRAARLLARLPRLGEVVEAGRVSFAQLRGLTLALKGLPSSLDATVDAWLAEAANRLAAVDADPDALVEQARAALLELTTCADEEQDEAALDRRLVLQPRLDGAGGRFYGEEDAYGFAILEAATAPRRDQLDDAGRARADNLQAWLHHTCHEPHHECSGDSHTGDEAAGDQAAGDQAAGDQAAGDEPAGESHAAADTTRRPADGRPDADLSPGERQDGTVAGDADHGVERDGHTSHGHPGHGHTGDGPPTVDPDALLGLPDSIRRRILAGGDLSEPKLLVRLDLDTLLNLGQVPADVLVRLVGGRLRLTSTAARQVIDRAGAQIRAVVVDDGEVVGVGRATRVPPGWLADAIHAVHDTCTGPLCDRPALAADLDHADPWTPTGDRPGGPTDLDNLGPLCAATNRDRAATGWTPTQRPGRGLRTWRHQRSGLSTTSVPATWRPPGHRPPASTADPPDPPAPPAPPHDDPPPF